MKILAGSAKIILLVALIAFSKGYAKDLGVVGKTYPIMEEDMVLAIKNKLQAMQDSGELDEKNQELVKRSKGYVKRPSGVVLPRTQEYRAVKVDPTYTLQKDITDADGMVLFKAGTQINPLDYKPLNRTLCFIDADDQEQVQWLQSYCFNDQMYKMILVNGDYLETSKQLGKRLYFDQRGYLVSTFGIQAVPAVIRQSGRYLYVEEFEID